MNDLSNKIKIIKKDLEKQINSVITSQSLETIRILFLGKKGKITQLMSELKNLDLENKKKFGPLLNKMKKESEELIKNKKEQIIKKEAENLNLKKQNFDITSYQTKRLKGHIHPYSQFIEEIENIFISMGFDPLDGPEVESDYNNFTALNVPENHPARDMYDTLWLNKPNTLMRTHTSTIQIHTMKTKPLPISGFAIGRAYRHESIDASHDFMFMQCEGILIDKNITLSNLFAVAKKFLQQLFKKDLEIRIRPGFFPFVEPGVEIDTRCPFCKNGCSVCYKTTWIEVFPGGLIHPNVLKSGGIDPEQYSGFAFGFGLTRLAMLKYNINDVRHFYSGKLKFLEQF